jgi:heme oxygenase
MSVKEKMEKINEISKVNVHFICCWILDNLSNKEVDKLNENSHQWYQEMAEAFRKIGYNPIIYVIHSNFKERIDSIKKSLKPNDIVFHHVDGLDGKKKKN